MVQKGLLYTKEHEWVKVDGEVAVVGITDHAQHLLGEVTFVELPEKEAELRQGAALGVVESSKAASDVYSPVTGTVTDVNTELESRPELINQGCYQDGWICKMNVTDPGCTLTLMDAKGYEKYLKEL